eukprot:CAMPEP_0206232324 /NCGR_PEP_ID=MMETSP0047_2-20121206/11351_1 /ASSEMBLY_ACC=CAM_ASM_000192 /TAXON_ID=195065 /ORGANISM="Chroomonas mesostigmatica_cf, Strain CCMP1168" /LENGTH=424 /DNA_ID=CAMNT_0053656045 /DNA_START=98 /DNA_END=1372 /DNA_ORIENTATION=+
MLWTTWISEITDSVLLRSQPRGSAGGPIHGAAADDVHVDVEDRLLRGGAVVDDHAVALELLLLGDLGDGAHHVAEDALVVFLSEAQLREPLPLAGNDEQVRGSLGVDVPKHQAVLILEDNVRGDLLGDDLVEDGSICGVAFAGEVDRVPALGGVPAIKRPRNLVVDLGEVLVVLADPLEPLVHARPKARLLAPPVLELGHHLHNKDESREHSRISERQLRPSKVRARLLSCVVEDEQLLLEVGESGRAHRVDAEGGGGLVQAALDGRDVGVMQATQELAARAHRDSGGLEGRRLVGVLVEKVPRDGVALREVARVGRDEDGHLALGVDLEKLLRLEATELGRGLDDHFVGREALLVDDQAAPRSVVGDGHVEERGGRHLGAAPPEVPAEFLGEARLCGGGGAQGRKGRAEARELEGGGLACEED